MSLFTFIFERHFLGRRHRIPRSLKMLLHCLLTASDEKSDIIFIFVLCMYCVFSLTALEILFYFNGVMRSLIMMWLSVLCFVFLVLILFIWLFGNFSVSVSARIVPSLLVFSGTPNYSYIGPFKHTLPLNDAMFIKILFCCSFILDTVSRSWLYVP